MKHIVTVLVDIHFTTSNIVLCVLDPVFVCERVADLWNSLYVIL